MDVVQCDVALASLDRPCISAMHACEVGERLLREPALETQLPDTLPELAPSAPCDCLACPDQAPSDLRPRTVC